MKYEYNGTLWEASRTKSSRYSFFHAAFGVREEGDKYYQDRIAHIRQKNWLNFLIYYENKPRPPLFKEKMKDYFTSRGWSSENDEDFKKYIHKIEREWAVQEEDLPLVSAVENVKIVLFHVYEKHPTVIEPNVELLGDYPLRCINSELAIVVVENFKYKKLHPLVQTSSVIKTQPSFNVYKKRAPVNALIDIFYQINLLAIVLLNALKYYENWRLAADVDGGYFNDVVFSWGQSNNAFLMQVYLSKKQVTEHKLLVDTYSGFSLLKYFFAYQEVKTKYNVRNVVLCTSAGISLGSVEKFVNKKNLVEGDLLYCKGTKSECYTFRDTMIPLFTTKLKTYKATTQQKPFITEENVRQFLNDFQMIVLYESDSLEEEIDNRIIQLGLADKHNSIDYARYLHRKLVEWYDESNEFLTPLAAKVIFSELIRIKLINKIRSTKIEFQKSNISISKPKVLHFVSQNDCTLSLVRVVGLLEKDVPKILFCNGEDTLYQQKLVIESFHHSRYSTLVIFAQKQYVSKSFEEILRVLQEFGQKKVVIIAHEQDELAGRLKDYCGDTFQTINDTVTIGDFTAKSQDLVFEKALRILEASIQKHE